MDKEPIKKTRKKGAGRPTVMTDFVIRKLEDAFLMGCSDREACLYADIVPSTLYKYCDEHPGFSERKELLKENPFVIARQSILKGMTEDGNLALKYMSKKKSEEFSERNVNDNNNNNKEDLSDSDKQVVLDLIERVRSNKPKYEND